MNQNTNSATDLEKTGLGKEFRRRAKQLRIQAFAVLGTIILLLGAAIWIFFEAAEITKQDVAVEKVFRRSADIESRIADLEAEIPPEPVFKATEIDKKKYNDLVAVFTAMAKEFKELLNRIDQAVLKRISLREISIDRGTFELEKVLRITEIQLKKTLDEGGWIFWRSSYRVQNLIEFERLLSRDITFVGKLQKIVDELLDINKQCRDLESQTRKSYDEEYTKWSESTEKNRSELGELKKGLELVKENERLQRFGLETTPQQELNISVPFLIQTNVTRFGPMIIIFFFVSLMVNLYRYNIRLSAYYDARADALELIGLAIDPDAFEKYVSSLSPDTHDLGKPPKLPTEHAIDLAKAAVSKVASDRKG